MSSGYKSLLQQQLEEKRLKGQGVNVGMAAGRPLAHPPTDKNSNKKNGKYPLGVEISFLFSLCLNSALRRNCKNESAIKHGDAAE